MSQLIAYIMKRKVLFITMFSALLIIVSAIVFDVHIFQKPRANTILQIPDDTIKAPKADTIRLINSTFLGNAEHTFYGDSAPSSLNIIWKKHLGTGKTRVGGGLKTWAGAGWTGQPLMVIENDKKYIIQGTYSHNLRKIDAETGEFIWAYKFDDVLKGTGSIWVNDSADNVNDKFVILQGSRKGNNKSLSSKIVPSYRAVSYMTGKELWRYNSLKTRCYSRDVDGSAIFINDTAYLGLENGKFIVFDPDYKNADTIDGILQPHVYSEHKIYADSDAIKHGGNLVMEASVTKLKNRIYIATGAGHVYGYNIKTDSIDWDFFTGSDIDGTPTVTHDSCLIVAIEKEYIKGQGGVFKLNPDLPPDSAVVWYYPTPNKGFHTWAGGVIGSATVNTYYNKDQTYPNIAVFTGIDGWLYVVDTDSITTETSLGPNYKKVHPKPLLLAKYQMGPSIATPIVVGNKLIAAGYHGLYLFSFDENIKLKLLGKFAASFEATPFVYEGRIYVASRNGYLYCFGDK
jgi:outer membrane protein assembly factor BamB